MQPQLALTVPGTDRHYRLAPGAGVTVGRTIQSEIHLDEDTRPFRGDAILASPGEGGA